MTAQYFIDTNVLLYAGSGANEDQAKKAIARQVLAQADIGFSAQVMQEFYYAAVRKERLKITHDEAVLILEALSPFPVLPVNRDLVLEAAALAVRYRLSYSLKLAEEAQGIRGITQVGKSQRLGRWACPRLG